MHYCRWIVDGLAKSLAAAPRNRDTDPMGNQSREEEEPEVVAAIGCSAGHLGSGNQWN